jgi:hypothetical protein
MLGRIYGQSLRLDAVQLGRAVRAFLNGGEDGSGPPCLHGDSRLAAGS